MQNLLNLPLDSAITDCYKTFKTKLALVAKLNDELKAYELVESFPIEAAYDEFFKQLPEDHERIVVVNFKYTTESDGNREKIILIHWGPSGAKIKERMVYTASSGVFSAHLDGIAFTMRASNVDEISYDSLRERCLGRYK